MIVQSLNAISRRIIELFQDFQSILFRASNIQPFIILKISCSSYYNHKMSEDLLPISFLPVFIT